MGGGPLGYMALPPACRQGPLLVAPPAPAGACRMAPRSISLLAAVSILPVASPPSRDRKRQDAPARVRSPVPLSKILGPTTWAAHTVDSRGSCPGRDEEAVMHDREARPISWTVLVCLLILGLTCAPALAFDLGQWVPGLKVSPFLSERVEYDSNVFQTPSHSKD